MLEEIVQDQVTDLLAQQDEWLREVSQDFNFAALEAKVGEVVNRLGAEVLKAALSALLMAPEFIQALKDLGARLGMRGNARGAKGPCCTSRFRQHERQR